MFVKSSKLFIGNINKSKKYKVITTDDYIDENGYQSRDYKYGNLFKTNKYKENTVLFKLKDNQYINLNKLNIKSYFSYLLGKQNEIISCIPTDENPYYVDNSSLMPYCSEKTLISTKKLTK